MRTPMFRLILLTALLAPALIAGKIPIKKDEATNAVSETVNFTGTVSIGGTSLGALPLTHEKGGLEADVSAYSGLVKITGGATSAVTITSAGEAILDDANAAAQRTTLGLGTIATQAASSVSITGGSISGITDLAVADGGTGVSSLSDVLGTSNQITVTSGTARVIGGNVTLAIAAVLDLGANTSVEIPNGTTPTVDAAGEIAIDTNGDGTNVTQGLITYYDGTTQLYAAAFDTYPTTDGHVLTYDSGTNKLVWEAAGGGGWSGTYRELWIPAGQFILDGTNPPALATDSSSGINTQSLLFDDTTDEIADYTFSLPDAWNLGSISIKLHWYAAATTGDVVWKIEGFARADGASAVQQTPDPMLSITPTVTGTTLYLNITDAGTAAVPGIVSVDDLITIRVYRDANAGGDTMTGDAKLLGIKIQYLEDATEPTGW